MSLQEKYRDVLELGVKLNIKDGYVNEEDGVLKIGGTAPDALCKDMLWDQIKKTGGEKPTDLVADIKVAHQDFYGTYEVQKGDTLGKISKMFLGAPGKYMEIFNLNTDQLKDPNLIHVGQVLKIPFKS